MKKNKALAAGLAAVIAMGSWMLPPTGRESAAMTGEAMGPVVAHAEAAKLSQDAIVAQSAILIDADTGEVLFEKQADQRRAPASTTKIMTLLLAVEKGDLDRMVTVPSSAGTAPSDSTRVPVYEGERMPFRDLLYGLMMKSGNDAANAIGTLSSGSVAQFVAEMNRRAAALNLRDTHFVNAHGYPTSGHYTTARDLAQLTRVALEHPVCRQIISTRTYTMAATARRGALRLTNGYAILDPDSELYDARAFGVKTGYASSAGQCFVGAASKGGKSLISVVLHSGLGKREKWIDTKKLFDHGFRSLGS